jgi:hypothetical protein
MPWTGDIDHVQILTMDHPVKMDVDEIQAGCRSPMSEETGLDMLKRERFFEKGIVVKVDLTD